MPKDENEPAPTPKTHDKIENTLLEARRLLISDAIDSEMAGELIQKLWYLDIKDPGKPILIVINSPGGSVDAGFAIWDQIQMIKSPTATLVTGLAASMGSILSLCCGKGKRFATARARFMIHQPMLSGVIKGQATDLEIQAKEMIKTRDTIVHLYMDATGKDYDTIERAIDRDTWMTADEAKDFGLVDGIIKSFDELQKKGFAV